MILQSDNCWRDFFFKETGGKEKLPSYFCLFVSRICKHSLLH